MKRFKKHKFIKIFVLFVIFIAVPPLFINCRPNNPDQVLIDKIELYRVDVTKERHFSHGTWKNRQHVFIKLSAGDKSGWSETIASKNNPDLDLNEWSSFLKELKGKTISNAFRFLISKRNDKIWTKRELEFVEMSLLDVSGRLQGKSALELLGLTGREPIYGTFCVLEEDPAEAQKQVQLAFDQNLKTHIKVKLFGKEKHDIKLIEAIRKKVGPETYIIADPNRGYKSWENLDELARILRALHDKGMNACEDPASLTNEQWIELQQKVKEVALIPDYNLRPAWEAVNSAMANMGMYYNFHPACMGSFEDMVNLGNNVKSWGHQVMIGDASLIGPGCTAWQQIAIGMGAAWVEALEKPQESDVFSQCIISQATYRLKDGRFAMKPKPGFGLKIDDELLKEKAIAYCSL